MAAMHYGDNWRRHRRAFWQHFLPAATPKYFAAQRNTTHLFLRKLLADPTKLCEHIR